MNSYSLGNEKIRVVLDARGSLKRVENPFAGENYAFASDVVALETDRGTLSNAGTEPTRVIADDRRIEFRFAADGMDLALTYNLEPGNAFFRRNLSLRAAAAVRLANLVLGDSALAQPARDAMHYLTFIAAPTVEFLRHEKGGLFTGIENPYFQTDLSEQRVTLSFEPALILKPGEGYVSEPQFMGVYKRSGVMVEDSARPFRYSEANGSGYKPIDRNEIRAMRAFALDYLAPVQSRFLIVSEQFFHPLPHMPRSESDVAYHLKAIDSFAAIGGDMIAFKPLHPHTKPTAERPYWNLLPDDVAAPSRRICDYARSKGISYGFYTGTAGDTGGTLAGAEGTSGGLNFRPDRPQWKKSDAAGRRAPDNCLACDEFFEWFCTVQENTIRKYDLSNWCWDPSLGSGMNCHDESHGHFAGKGGYKGWRRGVEMMGRLKSARPGLFLWGYYGVKQHGLWGRKHIDQDEMYNECAICVSTRHNQISDDRQLASDVRFQSNWSMRFRFTPPVTHHAYVHRINEGMFAPDLAKAWDHYGWKFSILSTLAVAGSLTPCILPYETDLVPGYVEFLRKWAQWGRDHFDSVNCTEPFGEQLQPGAVDGYARIRGDHGYVFLFNNNPRPAAIAFEVGDEINLQAKERYEMVELYPSEAQPLLLDAEGRSAFDWGTKVRVIVPANDCFLFELRKVAPVLKPVMAGAAGAVERQGDALEITGLSGKPGAAIPVNITGIQPQGVKRVHVNGVPQEFAVQPDGVGLNVRFAGQRYVRELDAWTLADGKPFAFPRHPALSDCRLRTVFTLNADVPQLLAAAKPRNFDEMDARIVEWQTGPKRHPYHNLIGSRPSRLWLIIPFLRGTDVAVSLNRQAVASLLQDAPSCSAFADITEQANYGGENRLELSLRQLPADTFMGPFLLYPAEADTTQVLAEAVQSVPRVVYAGDSLVPAPKTRYRKSQGPRILEARMMGHVTLKDPAELRVKVDLPPEQIAHVSYFGSGFQPVLMGKVGLTYDKDGQFWTGMVVPHPWEAHIWGRGWVQENELIYVWAEGIDGLRSEYYPVEVEWDFC